MGFCDEMKAHNQDVWHASMTHPFLQQLVTDELPYARFLHYLHQDAWFLREEAKVMGIAISRAPDLESAARLAELIGSVNAAEQGRHRAFAERLGQPIASERFTPSPTAYHYVSHMRSVALDGCLAEILAALLPCPWLYSDFGQHFKGQSPQDPIYKEWLEAYQSPLLGERVAYQRQLLEHSAVNSNEAARERTAWYFKLSIHYEHAFWEMALAGAA